MASIFTACATGDGSRHLPRHGLAPASIDGYS